MTATATRVLYPLSARPNADGTSDVVDRENQLVAERVHPAMVRHFVNSPDLKLACEAFYCAVASSAGSDSETFVKHLANFDAFGLARRALDAAKGGAK